MEAEFLKELKRYKHRILRGLMYSLSILCISLESLGLFEVV